nr:Gag-polypeptide of LTR copia-type [Tanacetum cinerariifolium]
KHKDHSIIQYAAGIRTRRMKPLSGQKTKTRTQILATKPVPTLGTAYHMEAEDERQRAISLENQVVPEPAAFKAFQRRDNNFRSSKEKYMAKKEKENKQNDDTPFVKKRTTTEDIGSEEENVAQHENDIFTNNSPVLGPEIEEDHAISHEEPKPKSKRVRTQPAHLSEYVVNLPPSVINSQPGSNQANSTNTSIPEVVEDLSSLDRSSDKAERLAHHNNGLDDLDISLRNRLLHQDKCRVRPVKAAINDSSIVSPSTPLGIVLNLTEESCSTWLDYVGPLITDELDSEKRWSYRDPDGNVQGSFSLAQLRM